MKLDNMKVNLKGNEITLRNVELEGKSVLKKLGSLYDEHAKLLFLFDVSGSMNTRVAKSYTDQYLWTPEFLTELRAKVADAVEKYNAGQANPMAAAMAALLGGVPAAAEFDPELLQLRDEIVDPEAPLAFNPKDDDDLKERVVRADLIGHLDLKINWSETHEMAPTRMEIVRRLAKQEIAARFKRFPKSRVSVTIFAGKQKTIFDDGDPEQLWPELEKLDITYEVDANHTDILGAIKAGMNICRAKPSQVGIHHFIMVSDGGSEVSKLHDWLPTLRASGVVIDYIHIGDMHGNEDLKTVCEALGGAFVCVNSEKAFEDKFVEVVNRPMLPPASK